VVEVYVGIVAHEWTGSWENIVIRASDDSFSVARVAAVPCA
jgi:hypothetical protein